MSKRSHISIWLMALTMLIDFTGFGLILPQLPFWAQQLGANASGVGLIITSYALAQMLFTPLLGALSDRYGRRPIIVASLCIEALSLVLTALASTLPLLLLARFISGLGASNIGSAQAVVSDVTSKQERVRGMGLIGAMIGLGFVLGPALGGLLAPFGPALPFLITAGAALLNALLVLLFLPETRWLRGTKQETGGTARRAWLGRGWRHARNSPIVLTLIIINLLFTIAFTTMETVLPLFTQHYFGWEVQENGFLFAYVGIIGILMQGGIVRVLAKQWGERTVFLLGLLCFSAGLCLLAFSVQLAWFFVALGIMGVGEGAVMPTISTLLTFASPEHAQGEILGLSQGMGGLGRILGPLLASLVYERISPGAPLFLGGVLVLLVTGAMWPVLRIMYSPGRMQRVATDPVSDCRPVSHSEKSL